MAEEVSCFFLLKFHSLCRKYIFLDEKIFCCLVLPVLLAILCQAVKIMIDQIFKFWVELSERSTQMSSDICHYSLPEQFKILSALILIKDWGCNTVKATAATEHTAVGTLKTDCLAEGQREVLAAVDHNQQLSISSSLGHQLSRVVSNIVSLSTHVPEFKCQVFNPKFDLHVIAWSWIIFIFFSTKKGQEP